MVLTEGMNGQGCGFGSAGQLCKGAIGSFSGYSHCCLSGSCLVFSLIIALFLGTICCCILTEVEQVGIIG